MSRYGEPKGDGSSSAASSTFSGFRRSCSSSSSRKMFRAARALSSASLSIYRRAREGAGGEEPRSLWDAMAQAVESAGAAEGSAALAAEAREEFLKQLGIRKNAVHAVEAALTPPSSAPEKLFRSSRFLGRLFGQSRASDEDLRRLLVLVFLCCAEEVEAAAAAAAGDERGTEEQERLDDLERSERGDAADVEATFLVVRAFLVQSAPLVTVKTVARRLQLRVLLMHVGSLLLGIRSYESGELLYLQSNKAEAEFLQLASVTLGPRENATLYLQPVVVAFFRFLRSNRNLVVNSSHVESLLAMVPQDLRTEMRCMELSSPEDLYQSATMARLRRLPLPPADPRRVLHDTRHVDLQQALKDLQREPSVVLQGAALEGGGGALGEALSAAVGRVGAGESAEQRRELVDCALVVASRTVAGDSFFVLQELFGSEEAILLPDFREGVDGIFVQIEESGITVAVRSTYSVVAAETFDGETLLLMKLASEVAEFLPFALAEPEAGAERTTRRLGITALRPTLVEDVAVGDAA